MTVAVLSDRAFSGFQRFIREAAGIELQQTRKPLVAGRLARRVIQLGCRGFDDYLALLHHARDGRAEHQTVIDLLTTNETYFFRDARHFEMLRQRAQAALAQRRGLRVWSAACSSGEEAYSIAMVVDDCMGPLSAWEVLGTDVSLTMLRRAARGHYPETRARQLPPNYRSHYCLRGIGPQAGTLLVQAPLRQRVRFAQLNLVGPWPPLGRFDVIFLRNVLIYFDAQTKRAVLARLLDLLAPGGDLYLSLSESLNDPAAPLTAVGHSVYRKG